MKYDLKINFVSPITDVKTYKEYKNRDIDNILYWIDFYRQKASVLSYEIRESKDV